MMSPYFTAVDPGGWRDHRCCGTVSPPNLSIMTWCRGLVFPCLGLSLVMTLFFTLAKHLCIERDIPLLSILKVHKKSLCYAIISLIARCKLCFLSLLLFPSFHLSLRCLSFSFLHSYFLLSISVSPYSLLSECVGTGTLFWGIQTLLLDHGWGLGDNPYVLLTILPREGLYSEYIACTHVCP